MASLSIHNVRTNELGVVYPPEIIGKAGDVGCIIVYNDVCQIDPHNTLEPIEELVFDMLEAL